MNKSVEGHSHEYVVFEDGDIIAIINVDFRPHKSGVAISVQYDEGVRLADVAAAFQGISESLFRVANGELEPEWELSTAEEDDVGPEGIPF